VATFISNFLASIGLRQEPTLLRCIQSAGKTTTPVKIIVHGVNTNENFKPGRARVPVAADTSRSTACGADRLSYFQEFQPVGRTWEHSSTTHRGRLVACWASPKQFAHRTAQNSFWKRSHRRQRRFSRASSPRGASQQVQPISARLGHCSATRYSVDEPTSASGPGKWVNEVLTVIARCRGSGRLLL